MQRMHNNDAENISNPDVWAPGKVLN